MITKEKTVAEVVAQNMGADHVFSKYKIDFCCGGGSTMEAVCKENGVEFTTLKFEIETIKNSISGDSNFNNLDLISFIKQAKNLNHKYLNENIPLLLSLAAKVAEVHGYHHKEVIEINNLFSKAVSEVTEQLAIEENILFPFIIKFVEQVNRDTKKEQSIIEILEQSIKNIDASYAIADSTFKIISNLSSNYSVPEGACDSFKFLYEKLEEFEQELQKYIHFEKNVFFPKLLKLTSF